MGSFDRQRRRRRLSRCSRRRDLHDGDTIFRRRRPRSGHHLLVLRPGVRPARQSLIGRQRLGDDSLVEDGSFGPDRTCRHGRCTRPWAHRLLDCQQGRHRGCVLPHLPVPRRACAASLGAHTPSTRSVCLRVRGTTCRFWQSTATATRRTTSSARTPSTQPQPGPRRRRSRGAWSLRQALQPRRPLLGTEHSTTKALRTTPSSETTGRSPPSRRTSYTDTLVGCAERVLRAGDRRRRQPFRSIGAHRFPAPSLAVSPTSSHPAAALTSPDGRRQRCPGTLDVAANGLGRRDSDAGRALRRRRR